jgi:FtsP/CotA-like multicopper oxidase with cupredoxin domain
MHTTSDIQPARWIQDRSRSDHSDAPDVSSSQQVTLDDGASFSLHVGPVTKRLNGSSVRMLAYNGSVPGPTLRIPQGARVAVDITNDGDLETTVHWHGLRLENRFDGTHQTQEPIPVGGRQTVYIDVPDPGIYWYHPHIRQDYGLEMGLYGTIIVEPADPDYWPRVNREVVLTLDDILLEDGQVARFDRSHATHTAMGRFGGVFLVAGEQGPELPVDHGEVVRLYLVNTANTRVFNVAMPGASMKLVGGDSGRIEHETYLDAVLLAPSERAVVDVLFHTSGVVALDHLTPNHRYSLANVSVSAEEASPSFAAEFKTPRTNIDLVAERARIHPYLDAEPDKTLAFVAEMDMAGGPDDSSSYACPMHPEVTAEVPGRCPRCGMKLLSAAMVAPAAEGHVQRAHDGRELREMDDTHGDQQGIEWEDDMVEVNRSSNPDNMRWLIVDRATNAQNEAIDWRFRVGDQVKIRLVNDMDSDHPMHHPFHVHGAGRFLVLSRDDVVEPNVVWKDTVLVRTGETVDILLDVANPGIWMAHCHIAEHHESGMMFSFHVDPTQTAGEQAER